MVIWLREQTLWPRYFVFDLNTYYFEHRTNTWSSINTKLQLKTKISLIEKPIRRVTKNKFNAVKVVFYANIA